MNNRIAGCAVLVFIILLAAGCAGGSPGPKPGRDKGSRIKYADHIVISDYKGVTRIEIINPWQKASGVLLEYFLLKRGEEVPEWVSPSKVIYIPVEKIVLMSTTYISMISSLGKEEAIRGISGTGFVYDGAVRKMIKEGKVAEIGYEENLNRELLISINPDLVVAYGIGSETAGYLKRLEEAGIRTLYNADYLEEHPLGKAEWIKMFGDLFCLGEKADSLFASIENEYLGIVKEVTEKKTDTPSVLLGLPWQNAWYVSPGNSYISNLIKDAGGKYIWEDLRSDHAVPMGIENIFVKASPADFWLNAGNAPDMEHILALDKRLASLKPVAGGRVFNNNKRLSPEGGNDYWESGAMSPQTILKDIASILHPGLFSGYEPFYYLQLK